MLECVYIVRNCVGNVVSVCDELPMVRREVCETCGDYATSVEQVWFIRCGVDCVRPFISVNPISYGVTWADIDIVDDMEQPRSVYLVPERGEPEWDRVRGDPI